MNNKYNPKTEIPVAVAIPDTNTNININPNANDEDKERVKRRDIVTKNDLNRSVLRLLNSSECFPILSYFLFVVVYVLCFVCLFKTNIEFISWWFFFVMNLLFMLFILKEFMYNQQPAPNKSGKQNLYLIPDHVSSAISKYTYMVTGNIQGKLYIPFIIIIGSILSFIPLVFIIIVFKKIHSDKRTKNIDKEFGNQLKKKESLKILLIIQLVLVWILYIIYNVYQPLFIFIEYYFLYNNAASRSRKILFIAFNMIYLLLSSSVLALGGYNTWLSYSIAKHMGSLSNPLISH